MAVFCVACVDFIMSPSLDSLREAFVDWTLIFGLLPNANIKVIGVGWFLGVIFVFYMVFPFFCSLLSDKIRAWICFAVAILINICSTTYFFDSEHVIQGFYPRTSFIYCMVFFVAGGIVYLYRNEISRFCGKFQAIVIERLRFYLIKLSEFEKLSN